jgi:hypothetical protein
LDNINNNSFVPKEPIFVSPENNNAEQSTNSRPRNASSPLAKDKINNIISFSISGINNTLGIINTREKVKKIDFYNIINNTIFKIDIFFFLIKTIY